MTLARTSIAALTATLIYGVTCGVSTAAGESRALPIAPERLDAQITKTYPQLDAIYKDIHSHPELGFQEFRTSALLARELRRLGFKVTEKVGGTGVVALYENGPGPTVMVRTELDALPMLEKTGLPYASTVTAAPWEGTTSPVMHACGHDIHMAAWVGAAQALVALKDTWSGTLMFVGQPSEETVSGAKAMLADGIFTRFRKPDFGFALHDSNAPAGLVMLKLSGTSSSAVDNLEITFKGRGGHGSNPSVTIDPIVIASHFVSDVQTIVSREKEAGTFGVITVGAFQAGTVGNIIPDQAVLKLTLRSHSAAVRTLLLEGVKRTAAATAAMANAPAPEVKVLSGTGSMANDDALAARTAEVFKTVFGDKFVAMPAHAQPGSASEDYSEFMAAGVPSAFFGIGGYDPKVIEAAKAAGTALPANHSPFFAPTPEVTIKTGVRAMTYAVTNVMPRS